MQNRLTLLAALGFSLAYLVDARAVGEETTASQQDKVVVKRDVVYGNVQGAGLLADIAYPEGKGLFPVILSVHGGRWVASSRKDAGEGAIDVQQWAGFGFFAMTIDYRLAGCTPPPACYQDLQCAIRWVHAHADEYQLDPERIFLIGMSSGGHLVALAATLGDGPFARTGGWENSPLTFAGSLASPPRTSSSSCRGAVFGSRPRETRWRRGGWPPPSGISRARPSQC